MTTHPTIGTVAMGDNTSLRKPPELLTEEERKEILAEAELLWKDLQENKLGGFSDGNRTFYILHVLKWTIEKYGRRDVGLTWSKNELDTLSTRPAQEPVAWVIPGQDTARADGFLDAMAWQEGEFSRPLYAAPQPVLSQPEVKALEWNPFRAETPFGYYNIDDQTDRTAAELDGRAPFLLSGTRLDLSRHQSLDAAKAAAQADYKQRIRSALCPLSDIPAQAGEGSTDA